MNPITERKRRAAAVAGEATAKRENNMTMKRTRKLGKINCEIAPRTGSIRMRVRFRVALTETGRRTEREIEIDSEIGIE